MLRGAGAPVLATLLIALAFNPARVRLQRPSTGPSTAPAPTRCTRCRRSAQRLAANDDLGGVLDGIREALRLPFAALRSDRR